MCASRVVRSFHFDQKEILFVDHYMSSPRSNCQYSTGAFTCHFQVAPHMVPQSNHSAVRLGKLRFQVFTIERIMFDTRRYDTFLAQTHLRNPFLCVCAYATPVKYKPGARARDCSHHESFLITCFFEFTTGSQLLLLWTSHCFHDQVHTHRGASRHQRVLPDPCPHYA